MISIARRLAVVFLLCVIPGSALAQTGSNVLVVVNAASADSTRIAEHYVRARSIPAENVVRLSGLAADVPEVISRLGYERFIERPIADWLSRHSIHDRILYIVLTKGIPLRVEGTRGRKGTEASVDSELTLLYRALTGRPVPPQGRVENPYFAGHTAPELFKQFSHKDYDIFLVTRLDGFTVDEVLALIDRGSSPTREGRLLFDQKAALDDPGNAWLSAVAERLTKDGYGNRVVLETTSKPLTDEVNVLGYFSWGSNDPAIKQRNLNLAFVPGALAATFVSSDARTFREPAAEWVFGDTKDPKSRYGGSAESLIGDLVRQGATGVAGHVAEPYFDAIVRPNLLFPAYLAGLNLAEAFYAAMPYVSWQAVVVGDPLCAPFRSSPLDRAEADPPADAETERQVFFGQRRLEFLGILGLKSDALKSFLRGEAKLARGDDTGGRKELEAATALEPRLNEAHALLASLHTAAGEHDQAIERYRKILTNKPRDAAALNNLAYHLAVQKHQPADALPFAEKARLLEPGNAFIIDTLGWVHHLNGNRAEALRFLTLASRSAPENAEIRLHLAAALAAAGQIEAARRELTAALKARPDLEQHADVNVAELRKKIDDSQPQARQVP
jgi:uncharacterized protein (TIGR03790 family)